MSEADLERDIIAGTLPLVAFYKPAGIYNQHPGYAGLQAGDRHLGWIVDLMRRSPMRDSFAVIITEQKGSPVVGIVEQSGLLVV